MADVIASLVVDVHPSKAKLTSFCDNNYFLIASALSAYSLWRMMLRVVVEGNTRSLHNALYDHSSSRFDIVFHGIWAKTNPNMRLRFHMSWWNLEVSKFLAATLERFVCHFGQYGSTWMWHIKFLCELTMLISQLPWLFRMAKAVSSTIELVNPVTSDSVNLFHIMMWAFASKCCAIEQGPCSDGWQRTWWQMIHLIPGRPVSSIPLWKFNHHEDACLESFQVIGRFKPLFIEAQQASKTICKVRSLKSRMKTPPFLEDMITSSIELCQHFESNMAVGIRLPSNPTWATAERHVIVQQTVVS